MTADTGLRTVAGKALADPEFRQKLIDDPEAAVREAGIELSDEQMEALRKMDKGQFESGLSELDQRLTMSYWGRQSVVGPMHSPGQDPEVLDASQLKGWVPEPPPPPPDPLEFIEPCGWD